MKPKPYIILMNARKNKLTEAAMIRVHELTGRETTPLMASAHMSVIGVVSTSSPQTLLDDVRYVLGEEIQILVLEYSGKHAQWGLPEHNRWLSKIHSFRNEGG